MADNTIIRVTKAQKFEVIKKFIPADAEHIFPGSENKDAYVFNYDAIIGFLDNEIAQLAKKNSGDKKQTDAQKRNEVIKEAIVEYLASLPADKEGATCTQIAKDVLNTVCPDEATPQKASSMCRLLKQDGRVDSKEIKGGKTVFFLL